jgi:putative transposase
MRQNRAYHDRVYPTPAHAAVLARTCGCARFVSHWALRLRTDTSYERQARIRYADTSAALTVLKQQPETAWLNEVSRVPPQQALRHLDRAVRTFFEGHATSPTFHQKHGTQAAEYTTSACRWNPEKRGLTLAKMDTPLHIHWARPVPEDAAPTTVTVSRDSAGRYFVSIWVEEEIVPLPITAPPGGRDLGLQDVVVRATGEKVGAPRFFQADEKQLAQAAHRRAKKPRGAKNHDKARAKVASIHVRVAERRRDCTPQLSTRISRENQTIGVERLRVQARGTHPTRATAIHDVGWGEFVRQLTSKAAWYGRTLVAIDTWYPSSKRCSSCGHMLGSLSLAGRKWTCPTCGSVHDRDVNAAKNVLAAGLAVSAGAEAVRPGRVRPPSAGLREAGIPRR